MAHEFESGLLVGQEAWHGLGTVITDAPTLADGINLAGLNWDVKTEPLFCADGATAPGNAIRRQDTLAVLGIVGPRYTPLQNSEAFDWFEPFVQSGEVKLETAGSLRSGKRVWVLTKLNRDPMVIGKNDTVNKYLMLSNSHDGTMAVRVGFTPIRVVCANTLAMVLSNSASRLIRVRHSSSVKKNLENVRETIDAVNAEFNATAEQFRLLATKHIKQADIRKYVKLVMSVDEIADDKMSTRMKNIIELVMKEVETSPGSDLETAKGTLWGAYNGISYHLSHVDGRTTDNRYNSLWFGQNATLNSKALTAALALAS